jgi:hypothetical protein
MKGAVMDERTALAQGLLSILHRHGVTREVLELWIHVLESRASGSVTFHHDKTGRVAKYDLSLHGQPQALISVTSLTNMFGSSILRSDCYSAQE